MDGQNFNNEQNDMYQDNTNVTPVVEAAPEKKADACAIISLIVGILSILLACCYPYVGVVLAIVGIVLAVVSKKKNGKSGLATAGLICSIVGVALTIIMIILVVIGVAALASMGMDFNSLF